jgi:flagellar hook-basal body complex protein FliE
MAADINFSQASAAYKSASKMQLSTAESSLSQSPTLPDAQASRFEPNFEDLISESLDKAKNTGYKSEGISASALANKAEYHELVTAVNNAELTLRTVVSIRDRMISAYQDILKMPI